MVFTNEENEILNQAAEILARHVINGSIEKDVFDLFADMISMIDNTSENGKPTTQEKVNRIVGEVIR